MSAMRQRLAGAVLMVSVVGVGLLGATGCSSGPERSVEAFCSTMREEKARILAQFDATSGGGQVESLEDALAGFGASIQALGELRTYFRKLADVAPEAIRTEVELIRDAYDDQIRTAGDAASDPLGALGSALFGGLAISGQLDAVNDFALEHCGESI